jgi:hypothetical protein
MNQMKGQAVAAVKISSLKQVMGDSGRLKCRQSRKSALRRLAGTLGCLPFPAKGLKLSFSARCRHHQAAEFARGHAL